MQRGTQRTRCSTIVLALFVVFALSTATQLVQLGDDAVSASTQSRRATMGSAVTHNPKIIEVYSDPELFAALLNPEAELVLLSASAFTLDATYLSKVLGRYNLAWPYSVRRNITLQGDSRLPRRPTVDFKYLKGLLRLENGVTLTLINVILLNSRADFVGRIPGLDILAPTVQGSWSNIVSQSSAAVIPACYDAERMREQGTYIYPDGPRHDNISYGVPQVDCVNDTTADYMDRCWPLKVVLHDVIAYGTDQQNTTGMPVLNNIIITVRDSAALCEAVVDPACIATYGSPYFCLLNLQKKVLEQGAVSAEGSIQPRQTPTLDGGHKEGSGSVLTWALVGSLTGAAFLSAVVAAVVVIVRHHRSSHSKAQDGPPSGSSTHVNKTPGKADEETRHKTVVGSDNPHPRFQDAAEVGASRPIAQGKGNVMKLMDERTALHPRNQPGHQGNLPAVRPGFSVIMDTPITSKLPARSDLDLDVRIEDAPVCGQAAGNGDCSGALGRNEAGAETSDAHALQLLPVTLGKGGFGRVVEGLYNGQHVAVKILNETQDLSFLASTIAQSFQHEIQVLGRCQHPNIVRLLAACIKPPRLCLVMELMETSLESVLYFKGPTPATPMPLDKVLYIGIEVARALAYLHPTIMHRDLKPGNVLLNNPWASRPVVKLTDFGLSRLRETVVPTEHPDAGTPAYMAPECFDVSNSLIGHKVDVYSLGVMLWEMLAGRKPWDGSQHVAIAFAVAYQERRPTLAAVPPDRLPRKLLRLLVQCWQTDPSRRPAADEVAKELTLVLQHLEAGILQQTATAILETDVNPSAGSPFGTAGDCPIPIELSSW